MVNRHQDAVVKKCIQRCIPQTGCFEVCEEVPYSGGNRNSEGDDLPECEERFDCGNGGSGSSDTARPVDPNELICPAGYGPLNYLLRTALLPYRINFENESSAKAPAQIVKISNQFSTNFDWSTFELTEIAFGDHFTAVPAGTQHFTKVENMNYNGVSFEVHIEAGIHLTTGDVYTQFTSLDQLTGLPPAVDVGFLPP